jgi:hypothetical protein
MADVRQWENPDGSTNVDGWLAAYAEDDNTFWRTEPGHIMNVVDELIDRLGEPAGKEHHELAAACCARWRASRVEVHTAPVEHVCSRPPQHPSPHRCSCGAELVPE